MQSNPVCVCLYTHTAHHCSHAVCDVTNTDTNKNELIIRQRASDEIQRQLITNNEFNLNHKHSLRVNC